MFLQNQNRTMNRTDPILFKDKRDCCGCSACVAICPAKALAVVVDEEGFYYPRISTNVCIKCHQCIKVCPLKNDSIKEQVMEG